MMTASYHTLGCKLNFSETASIASILEQKGIQRAHTSQIPDLCVVNTCSVTSNADKKSRQLIRHLASKYPNAAIIVTGCYAQLNAEEAASLPNVVVVLGSNEKLQISQYIDAWLQNRTPVIETTPSLSIAEFMPSCERGDRIRYFLKVQDGCDYFCTYCTIPYARGRSRSGKIEDLVRLASEAADKGGKEIVITGVNIGTFGKDTGENLLSLLKALDRVDGIERYRISSIEPNLLTDDIIYWIARDSRTFMPHFHIPLQSGSDRVLKIMNRRYDTALFKSRIDLIHKLIPDAYIGVDIIAGARGETPEEWEAGFRFASNLDITKYHAFPYSERQGTKASLLDNDVNQNIRYQRVAMLNSLSSAKTKAFIQKNLGKIRKVLWEKPSGSDTMQGLSDNYIRIEAPLDRSLINSVSEVVLESIKSGKPEIVIGSHLSI